MNALLLNSLCEISLDGLATNEDGGPVTAVMSRVQAPVLPVTRDPYGPVLNPAAPRLPSALPAPGNFILNISLTSKIGSGRSGVVYGVEINPPSSQSSANHVFDMPPLVAKVCIPNRTDDMMNEASCYDEMECLQGVAIPRCYGFFQCRAVVPALHKYRVKQHERVLKNENNALEDRIFGEWDARQEQLRREGNFLAASAMDLEEPVITPITRPPPPLSEDTISVLLLERVGVHIPIGTHLPHNFKKDLYDMYADLGRLSIGHHDIRWANVLSTLPVEDGGLPGLPSPFTHRTYNFRIIDFDQSQKWDKDEESWYGYFQGFIDRITDNIPLGYVIEYWE